MGDYTIICRSFDGLPLVEVWDSSIRLDSNINTLDLNSIKLNTRVICRKLPSNDTKCTIIEDDLCYHYIIEDGVCYMNITDSQFPKKVVFVYLAELCQAFIKHVLDKAGNNKKFQDVIKNIEKPYHYINFDRTINKMRDDFKNPNSSRTLNMINNSLMEVTNIMKKNIDEILNRGENLEGEYEVYLDFITLDIGRMADGLRLQTEMFKVSAKKLSRSGLLRKYTCFSIGIIVVFLILIYYKSR